MSEAPSQTALVQLWIDRAAAGDPGARDELISCACDRLLRLTHKIKTDFPQLGRWEQTEDVCQNASMRLYRALETVVVNDPREFFRLAACQIRRELIDLARRYQGAHGLGAHHASLAPRPGHSSMAQVMEGADVSLEPARVAEWADFHEHIDRLPEAEREVFDLLWYHGLSQQEAAEVLQVDVRTIKRRWRAARLRLFEVFGGELPGS